MSTSAKKEAYKIDHHTAFFSFFDIFLGFFVFFFFEVTITVTTQAEFCRPHRKTSRCRTQRNYYYEVFRDIGKDMHGQSAGPSDAQRREEGG